MAKILFVGDIAIVNKVEACVLDEKLQEIFLRYDYRACNIEGPISNKKLVPHPKAGPHLLQNECVKDLLAGLSFSLFCLANNHIMDYGKIGLEETIVHLSGIPNSNYIGAGLSISDAYAPLFIEIDNVKIAFINAAENSFGVNLEFGEDSAGHAWLFSERFGKLIKETKTKCDKLILISHAGLENLDVPMPEWRRVYKEFVDMGVDVIIGHHPHVVQGWEKYNNGLIFYSLGNFLWKKNQETKAYETIAVGLDIEKNRLDYEVVPIRVDSSDSSCMHLGYGDNWDYFDSLCIQLDEKHQKALNDKVDSFCLDSYEKYFPSYLCYSSGNIRTTSIKSYIKQIIKDVLCLRRVDDVFTFHNIAVETNNWLCQRAIKSKWTKNNN